MKAPTTYIVLLGLGILAVPAMTAQAEMISPATVFGVEDDEFDGVPDGFSSPTLADAITTRFIERRSFAEFDIGTLEGFIVESATISGVLNEQFTFGFGTAPADFAFELYNGNGLDDLTDFNIAATQVGGVTVDEDFDSLPIAFDVADALQDLVDAGATHAGFRSLTTDMGVGQVDVNDLVLDVTLIPEPATLGLLAMAGMTLIARRRR